MRCLLDLDNDSLHKIALHAAQPVLAPWNNNIRLTGFADGARTIFHLLHSCTRFRDAVNQQVWKQLLDNLPRDGAFYRISCGDQAHIFNTHKNICEQRNAQMHPHWCAPWITHPRGSLLSNKQQLISNRPVEFAYIADLRDTITAQCARTHYKLTTADLSSVPCERRTWNMRRGTVNCRVLLRLYGLRMVQEMARMKIRHPTRIRLTKRRLLSICSILRLPQSDNVADMRRTLFMGLRYMEY